MTSTSAHSAPPPEADRCAFLGGAVSVWQPVRGYRAGVDPVLLAASVPARAGQTALELGCGVGVASLCLAHRVKGLRVTGVELQPEYAELARRNVLENGLPVEVVTADLADLPDTLRQEQFDHVFANPPYYRIGAGTGAAEPGRELALRETLDLAVWVDVAIRRLAPRGYLSFIQRADRLPDLLGHCNGRLGDLRVLPLASRTGRAAELVIVRGRKSAKGPFRMLAPVVMHRGDRHDRDAESYTPEIRAVLRNGQSLNADW